MSAAQVFPSISVQRVLLSATECMAYLYGTGPVAILLATPLNFNRTSSVTYKVTVIRQYKLAWCSSSSSGDERGDSTRWIKSGSSDRYNAEPISPAIDSRFYRANSQPKCPIKDIVKVLGVVCSAGNFSATFTFTLRPRGKISRRKSSSRNLGTHPVAPGHLRRSNCFQRITISSVSASLSSCLFAVHVPLFH